MTFEGGDFFTGELPAADVLLFGHILHDWDLETKRMLLRKAHAALHPEVMLSFMMPSLTMPAPKTPSAS